MSSSKRCLGCRQLPKPISPANYKREGLDVGDLVGEVVEATLSDAGVGPEQVEAIHLGNAFGQLFNGQGQLGAMPATVEPGLWGLPASRHEAACASGSIAVLSAMADIEAGRYDCILVLGIEQEKNVPGVEAPRYLGAAAWIGHEGEEATFMWPFMFSETRRRVRPPLRPRRPPPACHRRAQHAKRQGQSARPDAGVEVHRRQFQ